MAFKMFLSFLKLLKFSKFNMFISKVYERKKQIFSCIVIKQLFAPFRAFLASKFLASTSVADLEGVRGFA